MPRPLVPLLLTALGLGCGYAGAALAGCAGPRPSDGRVTAWAADRGEGGVVGLDDELLVTAWVPVAWPVALARRADGGAWVASAGDGTPRGPHALVRLTAGGERAAAVPVGVLGDLTDLDGGDALVLSRPVGAAVEAPWTLVRVDATGEAHPLARVDGATCVAGRGGAALVGDAAGGVATFDAATGEVRRRARALGRPVDAAAAPVGAGWLVLDGADPARLLRLEADLTVRWARALPGAPRRLGPDTDGAGTWVAAPDLRRAVRVATDGRVAATLEDVPLAGVEATAALPDGGALLAAPGAVLRVDADARWRPGQGGFGHLVDLVRVVP